MGGDIGERDAFVLGSDINEVRGEAGKLRGSREPAVEISARTRRGVNRATDDQFVVVGNAAIFEQFDRVTGRQFEERFDLRTWCPRADQIGGSASAQNKFEGTDKHRLTRAGFAGHNVESGLELHLEQVNEEQIFDAKLMKHSPAFCRPKSQGPSSLDIRRLGRRYEIYINL